MARISEKIKKEILKQQNNRCADCPRELTPKITHFDHILPKWDGGYDDLENIQALCANCHANKTHTENKKRHLRKKAKKDFEKTSSTIGDPKKEHQRFSEIYDTLTYSDMLSNPRFRESTAKKIAEVFCKEKNYSKFNNFLEIFDDLTYSDMLTSPRFNGKEALEMAFKRVAVPMNLNFLN